LLLHNRTLTNVAWVASNITPANDQVGADDVSNSASSITATDANGTILQTITSASAARATSAYVKRITGTGTIEMTQNNGSTWTAVTVTSAWTRITIPSATVTDPVVGFRIVTSGDAIAVDYAQLENGAFSTSAIGTTTAAVTRSADVASITGSAFSSWYRQNAVSVFSQSTKSATTTGAPFSINDGTANNRISGLIVLGSGFTAARNTAGAGTLFTPTTINLPVAGLNKTAQASTNLDHAIALNGGTVATAVTYGMPVVDRLDIGCQLGASFLNGALARLTIWPTRLPNTTLQALTQ
jgi:hypothetical protein